MAGNPKTTGEEEVSTRGKKGAINKSQKTSEVIEPIFCKTH